MPDIALQRLYNQRLLPPHLKTPAEVVSWLGVIQAQDFASATWSIGVRLPGITQAAVEQAIRDKAIVRTWAHRSTLHFLAAEDYRWIMDVVAPAILRSHAPHYKKYDLDDDVFASVRPAVIKVLEGGRQLTRPEFFAELEKLGISAEGGRGSNILYRSALERIICHSEMRGKDSTFTLLYEWLPPAKPLPREEGIAKLAHRYFTSHAPATLADFVWWTGLLTGEARAGLEAVKSEFVQEKIGKQTYWLPQSGSYQPVSSAVLLPGFDAYMLGYKDRGDVLEPQHFIRIVPGSNGVFGYTMVLDGQIVGTWKRTIKKKAVEITYSPFNPLDVDIFLPAAQGYGEFLELPVVIGA